MGTQIPEYPAVETETPGAHGVEPRGSNLITREGAQTPEGREIEGRFGLMFKLPPFDPEDDGLVHALANQMVEPVLQENDSSILSGFTVLGQFITHDLTFDTTPLAEQRADPDGRTNFRTPRFDLDSVYGVSPMTGEEPPRDPADPDKMLIENQDDETRPDDLPRRADGLARIGDPRNDENLVICQLHLAFLKLHNVFVDRVRAEGTTPPERVFCEAKKRCRWHFQWVVVHDYLPRFVDRSIIDQILTTDGDGSPTVTNRFYKPQDPVHPMMPLEFAAAAMRFGHSMIRPTYIVNKNGAEATIFAEPPDDRSLNGARPIPERLVVDWRRFFDIPGSPAPSRRNLARKIDGRLTEFLFALPRAILPQDEPASTVAALALRDLRRGIQHGLPSGQRVAERIRDELGEGEVLSNADLGMSADAGWKDQAPLWFYILKEAGLRADGERLGPVGGRIVAEVMLGLLWLDPESYLRQEPGFQPADGNGAFLMGDLLRLAGERSDGRDLAPRPGAERRASQTA